MKYNAWHFFFGLAGAVASTMDLPLFNKLRLAERTSIEERLDIPDAAGPSMNFMDHTKSASCMVIVGFPKCGTSALIRAFEADSDVSVLHTPDGKREVSWPMFRDMEPKLTGARLQVHKFTSYIYNQKALTYLAESDPDRQFVLCIRDPRRALVSWHNMHQTIARTGRTPNHFAYIERDFYSQCSVDEYYVHYAAENLRYDLHFRKLLSIVGPRRLIVVSQGCMARGMDPVVTYLKTSTPVSMEQFVPVTATLVKAHTGFADQAKPSFDGKIEEELQGVYQALMAEIRDSGVRTCL